MGQEYSVDEAEQSDASSPSQEREQTPEDIDAVQDIMDLSGYRVMKVFSGSPASRSNLRPFEDFIVALDGAVVSSDNASLNMALRNAEGRELALVVWNCVDNARRDVALRPVKWNGPGLLGSAVRYEQLRGAAEHVQRVVDVLPGSPADVAGLVPMTDYVVGTPAEVFKNEKQFGRAVGYKLCKTNKDKSNAC